jgi:hypothetical protein
MTYEEWEVKFNAYNGSNRGAAQPTIGVGAVTDKGEKLYEAKRNAEGRKAERGGVELEKPRVTIE